ncbi:SIS domain-containing protein [Bacteriovoracaceae bacterium]|nr:SIS domain-containing protein [Bacteriovoracaceae bacterium]
MAQSIMIKDINEYLNICSKFKLGKLTTESFHPLTSSLSAQAHDDLPLAFNILKEVDIQALQVVTSALADIKKLKLKVKDTINNGHRVFLCGCGATGRLSIVLESLFRQTYSEFDFKNNIVSFMAGGDLALIKSIESFEDETSYGVRQLEELGFKSGDLLIASTEGGETSFVIGAAQMASLVSPGNSVFVYCNPDSELLFIERSRAVLENEDIVKLPLACGPMALSGSTRMQATTVMMMSIGLALLNYEKPDSFLEREHSNFMKFLNQFDYSLMAAITEKEADLYLKDQFITYQTDSNIGLSILTDTTERSPTFSLDPFECFDTDHHMSLCYLSLKDVYDSEEAWRRILKRAPRCLEWKDINGVASFEKLLGFDISENAIKLRKRKKHQHIFSVEHHTHPGSEELVFDLEGDVFVLDVNGFSLLNTHLILKMLLNAHSTLVMGRMERYVDNVMTWVKPSNLKLIDRSVRYVIKLLQNRNIHAEYEVVANMLFKNIEHVTVVQGRPIVLRTLEDFL